MKARKLSTLKDGAKFRVSTRKTAATYKLHKKKSGVATAISTRSGRSYYFKTGLTVLVKEKRRSGCE